MSTYPTVRPSLTLDFQKSKQLDPRITFSRSSAATYVEGGLVKYAYTDQARFEDEGLLIEESRTNLLPESGNLNDQTYWHTFTNPGSLNQAANQGWMVATANTTEVVSPDGTNNACKLSGQTPSTFDKWYRVHVVPERTSVPMSANVVYSWTLFVKDPDSVFNGDNLLTFSYGSRFSNTNARVRFDLSNDTVTYAGDIANEDYSITPYPNGWKKLTATFTNTSSSGGPRYILEELSPNTGSFTQFSANGEKFYVWGFQIEEGAFPTSYIPTAGSPGGVIRAVDIAQITGDNFSSWWDSSEGTIVTVADNFPSNGSRKAWEFNDGSHVASGPTLVGSGTFFQSPVAGNYTNSTINFGSIKTKTAFTFTTNAFIAGSGDGSDTQTNTSGLDPNVVKVVIGKGRGGYSEVLNGTIARIHYYPTQVSNEQLEVLTS